METLDLFENAKKQLQGPLAYSLRPQHVSDFIGWENLWEQHRFLQSPQLQGLILWGPPGSGKTTLALLLAKEKGAQLTTFNAVMGNTSELRGLLTQMRNEQYSLKQRPLLFIDEVHRLHKAQQDALLPCIESGEFTLIGATTENPHICLNKALLSRLHILPLTKYTPEQIITMILQAQKKMQKCMPSIFADMIAQNCDGDARFALNLLEVYFVSQPKSPQPLQSLQRDPPTAEEIQQFQKTILRQSRQYDRQQNRHYDVISAFIKSMRGSDPDAAMLWLEVMLEGGEDPMFIARRCMIFAAEDVGNADPRAITLATSSLTAIHHIGMPEAGIILAQVVTYLASTVKSNRSYLAHQEAQKYVRQRPTLEVPAHLRSQQSTEAAHYQYPHDFPGAFVPQEYGPTDLPNFYTPSEQGQEKFLLARLQQLHGQKHKLPHLKD